MKNIFKLVFLKDDEEGWGHSQNFNKFEDLDLSLYQDDNRKKKLQYFTFVWGMTFLKTVMLGSDIYTCIKLLAFNIWSNNYIEPYVPFKISKWLFSVCIFISIILMVWDLLYGYRIYKTKIISLCFINNWSRTFYCLQSYSIFCLFDKITPSGIEQKLTFLTYFELKNCSRLLFADTPRQVINGLTLWTVLLTKNEKNKDLKDFQTLIGIWSKIKWMIRNNHEEALMLSFMLLSFLIWLIFISKFLVAVFAFCRVYYTVVKKQKFNGLKEYVCVTISYNIDYLTEKYQFKRFYSQVSLLRSDKSDDNFFNENDSLYSEFIINDKASIYEHVMENTLFSGDFSRAIFSTTPSSLDTIPSYYYKNHR